MFDLFCQQFNSVNLDARDLNLVELKQFISSPLQYKFPCDSKDSESICPKLLGYSLNNYLHPLFLMPVADLSFDFSDSESANISLLDRIIKQPLEEVSKGIGLYLEFGRNQMNLSTSVGAKRPNFITWLNGVLVLKGEEKGYRRDFDIAKQELVNKMSRCNINLFGEIPFVFSYAAANYMIQFFAFDRSSNMHEISPQFDLRNLSKRFEAVLVVLNILKIISSYTSLIPDSSMPMYLEMPRNNGSVTMYEDYILKKLNFEPYDSEAVDEIYEHIDHGRIRCSVQRVCRSTNGLQYRLKPVGFSKKPTDRKGLICALQCIATALADMHALGYVHRDIRWENIVRTSVSSYILIDFENSGRSGDNLPPELLNSRILDPNISMNALRYSTSSDMFQFGKLIDSDDKDLRVLRENLVRKGQRYTSVEVLQYLGQLPLD